MDKKYDLDKQNDDAQQAEAPTICEDADAHKAALKTALWEDINPAICLLIFYVIADIVTALQFGIYVGMKYEEYHWSNAFAAMVYLNTEILPFLWLKEVFTQTTMPRVISVLPAAVVMSFADIIALNIIINSRALNGRLSVFIILALAALTLSDIWKNIVLNAFDEDSTDSNDTGEDTSHASGDE